MTKRRDFIRISALGLGGLTIGGKSLAGKSKTDAIPLQGLSESKKIPSYCEVCFWECAAWVKTNAAGEIWNIEGNLDDPHCHGRLCPRGMGGIGMYHDKDRLTKPLLRIEKGGQQTFREASWEEALDVIATNFTHIIDQYGPESLALFNHGSSGYHFSHLMKALGTSNIVAPSYAQCRGPREAGWKATFGVTLGSPEPTDIRDTRCLVLIGSHIGENMHNGQVQEMSDAIDKDADIITVDPRYSTAASKSSFWLPIKPSTDLALLLAWIHVIIEEKLYDQAYVNKYTSGFDRLAHHVRRMTPEWAYGITTIKPDIIRKTARTMAKAAPAVIIHPGRHVTWYGDDTQRTRAIAILNAILGSWGQRGGFYYPERISIPSYPHPPYPTPRWGWRDMMEGKFPLAGLAVSNALIDASLPGYDEEKRIRGWLVSGTNLPLTLPDKETFEKAAQALDFMVVVDTMPMDITGYADVVLPECTYLERYDSIRNSPHREPVIALRMPAAPPTGESKPASWMAKQLAEKLGLHAYFDYEDYKEVLDWQLKEIGSSLEEMERIGVKKLERKFPLYMKEGDSPAFNTNSGKIELYATDFKAHGFDPLPNYKSHEEPPPNFYRLNYGRAPMHTFSRTANNANLTDLMDENKLWVNPKIARIWDLKNDQQVWLKNQDGIVSTFPIKIRVTERIRWDSVYMVHGFGHSNKKLTRAYGKGINDSEMISKVNIDPIMGGTGMRGNFVTFLLENPHKNEML